MSIFIRTLICIILFNIAFWLLALAAAVGFFEGMFRLWPWAALCWAAGMAMTLKREVGEKCRWFGWFLCGALCMYAGLLVALLHNSRLTTAQTAVSASFSGASRTAHAYKVLPVDRQLKTKPAKLVPSGKIEGR